MKNKNQCPVWTPLYWHRKLLQRFVFSYAASLNSTLRRRFPNQLLRVIDIGCGSKPYAEAFADVKYEGADIGVTEHAEISIDATSERIAVADESYHAAVSFQVMEHVADYRSFLRECRRVLVPGGIFFVTVPFAFEFHGVPSDYRRWTQEGLRVDLFEAGFTDIHVDAVEADSISVLTINELYLAARLGYRITKPVFFALNCLGHLMQRGPRGLIPLTSGAFCTKPESDAPA
jgi:SAM-dependent methyltransferase